MKRVIVWLSLFLPSLIGLTGCSFSDSSASSSSISDSFSSSSGSSKKTGKVDAGYQADIANLTFSVANTGISSGDFLNALSRTASQYKINDWTQQSATFSGIGQGLKKAGIPLQSVGSSAFLKDLLATNPNALTEIQKAY
mgnify:FL=1